MFLYILMYVYMCIICIYTCIGNRYVYIYTHVCIYVYYIYIYSYIYICVCVYIYMSRLASAAVH
jgi:hypothetical protein